MLGWSTNRMARIVEAWLGAAPAGAVAVVGDAALAKALARRGRQVSSSLDGVTPLAAVVRVGAPGDAAVLEETRAAIVDRGLVVLVEKTGRTHASARALSAGLAELEQRVTGRWVLTRGRVRQWARPQALPPPP